MTGYDLADLGWSSHFVSQLDITEVEAYMPARVSAVHRTQITALTQTGKITLALDHELPVAKVTVGDWVLCDPKAQLAIRRLSRLNMLQRGSDFHHGTRQLIAANINTLFITTSCNADFNIARLERYLALAHDAEITPVILLTKADQAEDITQYTDQAQTLGRDLAVVALDAHQVLETGVLAPWCGKGQTVALAGSSGVGKTTLTNALTGEAAATASIREDDAKGRHTTTGRSLHAMRTGGWLIDTPGMRSLGVADVTYGINATFPEISQLEADCKFRDCKHESEPGCAVQAAVAAGEVDPERLKRFQKLIIEDARATQSPAQNRAKSRTTGKMIKAALKQKKR